jgi:[ribosomal protein S18]-alanine N-acetyltransferase
MRNQLPYVVEPMALADVEQVMEIERQSFSAPWSARAYRYEINENDNSTMVVVRPALGLESALVQFAQRLGLTRPRPVLGYSGFWLLVDDAHISTIAVHPRWRGLGLGELLLFSMLERGEGLGAIRATLEVRVSNHTAQGLYHKYAFEIVSRRKRYYADNNEDAYIMATPPFATEEFQAILRQNRDTLYARQRAQGIAAAGNPRLP